MKHPLPLFLLLLLLTPSSCQKPDTINCTIYWQLYTPAKYITADEIEQAFQQTFFDFYERVNDNTVRARNTTRADVRSLTLKLATMADAKIHDTADPAAPVEVRVFINYGGSNIEEVWSKNY
jgi:hypothetical protein